MKIICIGRNYAAHAREMKAETPAEPVFFLKPDTALLRERDFYYPEFTKDLHHEVELVLKVSKNGRHIEERFAHKYYDQIGIGIDFTARDLQAQCKKDGLPWEKAKAFDHSAPVGGFLSKIRLPQNIPFLLKVNGELRQHGNSSDMLFSFDSIVSYVSRFVTLKTGDLIFTGTPEGVGPVQVGDKLEGWLDNEPLLEVRIR